MAKRSFGRPFVHIVWEQAWTMILRTCSIVRLDNATEEQTPDE